MIIRRHQGKPANQTYKLDFSNTKLLTDLSTKLEILSPLCLCFQVHSVFYVTIKTNFYVCKFNYFNVVVKLNSQKAACQYIPHASTLNSFQWIFLWSDEARLQTGLTDRLLFGRHHNDLVNVYQISAFVKERF